MSESENESVVDEVFDGDELDEEYDGEDEIVEELSDDSDEDDIDLLEELHEDLIKDDDKLQRVPNDERVSKPILTKYEAARIIGTRVAQLTNGAQKMVEYDEEMTTKEIAIKELIENKIPIIIKRPFRSAGVFELWRLHELNKYIYNPEFARYQ